MPVPPRPPGSVRFLPPLLWMAVIAVGSSSLLDASRTGAWLDAALGVLLPGVGAAPRGLLHMVLRKLGHVGEYGVLAVLWRRALAPSPRAVAGALLLAAGYAVVDELHQALTPTRGPAATDVVLDAAGALLGLAAWEGGARRLARTLRVIAGVAALGAGAGIAFLALDRALDRPVLALAVSTLLLAVAAWGAARAAAGAWQKPW